MAGIDIPITTETFSAVTDDFFGYSPNADPIDGGNGLKERYINPDPAIMGYDSTLIWIEMTAIPIEKLSVNARASISVLTSSEQNKDGTGINKAMATALSGAKRYYFNFLAQNELMESISHEWTPYESAASNMSEMYAKLGISIPAQISGAMKGLMGSGNQTVKGFMNSLDELSISVGTVVEATNKISRSGDVANYRVDTPLQYKGSNRREFELIFQLINTKKGQNYNEVVLPVKLLESMSSPSYTTKNDKANADILLPYLFEVKSVPGSLLYMQLAVLKAVNPTWKGPWIKGDPSRCELRLSFVEYAPLEQRAFFGNNDNNLITTFTKERADATSTGTIGQAAADIMTQWGF